MKLKTFTFECKITDRVVIFLIITMVKTKYVLFPHLRSCEIVIDVAVTDFYYRKMCSVPNLYFRDVSLKKTLNHVK